MIEVCTTYDLIPGINQQAYAEWVKKSVAVWLQAPGLIEIRARRNLIASPLVQNTGVWETLADWKKFNESAAWQTILTEARSFTTNARIEIWGTSPLAAETLRPKR